MTMNQIDALGHSSLIPFKMKIYRRTIILYLPRHIDTHITVLSYLHY